MRGLLEKTEEREGVDVRWGGKKIFGILHRPTISEKPPLVIVFHGFASSKHGSNRCYVTFAETLAQHGIATLRFDFRGSGDSEGHLSEMTLEDLVEDGLAVLNFATEIEGIDADRIALFGASLGGALAILAAARFVRVKALSLWAPVASGEIWYRDFLKQNPQYISIDPRRAFSSYRGIALHPLFREQFRELAAWKTVENITGIPTLFLQGEKDGTITMAHHEAFKKACGDRSNVRFVHYNDGEHALGFSPFFSEAVQESLTWFKRYL